MLFVWTYAGSVRYTDTDSFRYTDTDSFRYADPIPSATPTPIPSATPTLIPSATPSASPDDRVFIRETSARELEEHLKSLPPLQREIVYDSSYRGRWVCWGAK